MILKNILYFLSEDHFFTFTNSVDPDEIQHYGILLSVRTQYS